MSDKEPASLPLGLVPDWRFTPSAPPLRVRLKRLARWRLGRRPPPAFRVVRAPELAARWNVLFLYAPSGELDPDQQRILARVRALTGSLMVVLATEALETTELDVADALVIKQLSGYDFSGYQIALDLIARHSPGALTYLQNDSVFGPFGDMDRRIAQAPWDLTGVIASPTVENHISSFAFVLRGVTPARCAALQSVLSPEWSCDAFDDVILLQETRFARVASRSMSVGALWYNPAPRPLRPFLRAAWDHATGARRPAPAAAGDAMLSEPLALLEAGFPFVKRSLCGKYADLADQHMVRAALARHGWQLAEHPASLA